MRRVVLWWVVAAAATSAAQPIPNSDDIRRIVKQRPKLRPEDPIGVATPSTIEEALPSRFTESPRKPPVDLLSTSNDSPPISHVADLVCLGDAAMRSRWLAALESSGKESAQQLRKGYGEWLGQCDREEACRFFLKSAQAAKQPSVREHLFSLTEYNCRYPALAPLFLESSAPDATVMTWLSSLRLPDRLPAWDPRFADLLRRVATTAKTDPSSNFDPLVVAANTFALWRDPRALEALLRVHASLQDPLRKNLLAIGSSASQDKRALGLYRAACKSPPAELQRLCTNNEPLAPRSLDALVQDDWFEPLQWLAANPKREKELRGALQRCDDVDEQEVLVCLTHLARVDWAAARSQVQRIRKKYEKDAQSHPNPYDAPVAVALGKFESHDAFVVWAREKKVIGDKAPRDAVNVEQLLRSAGRLLRPASPEGLTPDHAHVMRVIADAAGLKDVSFEQTDCQRTFAGYNCVVKAWMDGKRWTVETMGRNEADWHMCAWFANALFTARKSPTRAFVVRKGDQDAAGVGVLPGEALRELVQWRLIEALPDRVALFGSGD